MWGALHVSSLHSTNLYLYFVSVEAAADVQQTHTDVITHTKSCTLPQFASMRAPTFPRHLDFNAIFEMFLVSIFLKVQLGLFFLVEQMEADLRSVWTAVL